MKGMIIYKVNKYLKFKKQITKGQNHMNSRTILSKGLIALIIFYMSLTISTEILKPTLNTYFGIQRPILNVTIGENFIFKLPQFDSPWEKNNFKAYAITENMFNEISNSGGLIESKKSVQKKQQKKQKIEQEAEMSMDKLPFKCELIDGSAQIQSSSSQIKQISSRIHNNVKYQQNQYVHLSFKSLLYVLNIFSSELQAYIYNDNELKLLTSYKFNSLMEHKQSPQEYTSLPVMAPNTKQDLLYIMTNVAMWQIQTKTILANVQQVQNISGFNSVIEGGIDKILHGESQHLIALKRMSTVYVIPEPSKTSNSIKKYTKLNKYNNIVMYPQDIKLISSLIYILDFYKGVYIFKIVGSGEIKEVGLIQFTVYGGNYQFQVFQNTIFINFNDVEGSKIVQISYEIQNSHVLASLVRYIKTNDFIADMNVFTVYLSQQTNNSPDQQQTIETNQNNDKNKKDTQKSNDNSKLTTNQKIAKDENTYNEDNIDTLLFFITSNEDLEIYSFNIDPHMITKSYNAVKLKINSLKHVFHIHNQRYILITAEFIKYVTISVQKPYIKCLTSRNYVEDPQISTAKYFKIEVISNGSTCQHKDHNQNAKKHYNEICEQTLQYYLHINDPEESEMQKVMLYGMVLMVVFLFVVGLFCLIQWRNNKMIILSRLKSEIIRFRNKHKRMQPFVEEHVQNKDVEIQIPNIQIASEEQE